MSREPPRRIPTSLIQCGLGVVSSLGTASRAHRHPSLSAVQRSNLSSCAPSKRFRTRSSIQSHPLGVCLTDGRTCSYQLTQPRVQHLQPSKSVQLELPGGRAFPIKLSPSHRVPQIHLQDITTPSLSLSSTDERGLDFASCALNFKLTISHPPVTFKPIQFIGRLPQLGHERSPLSLASSHISIEVRLLLEQRVWRSGSSPVPPSICQQSNHHSARVEYVQSSLLCKSRT
ncbi:hypothetical protein FA13DRAFT_1737492 [Coprinellus micaceus]|uniref:Uncharacterized protein n=1 Tax=Coprinellus micaceus TaxID=71717 RepID=A0A4Y7SXG0_COPMI|nr:hypothetical protein FA13DRAFT_1737492 [Coprinellus micaceus]